MSDLVIFSRNIVSVSCLGSYSVGGDWPGSWLPHFSVYGYISGLGNVLSSGSWSSLVRSDLSGVGVSVIVRVIPFNCMSNCKENGSEDNFHDGEFV